MSACRLQRRQEGKGMTAISIRRSWPVTVGLSAAVALAFAWSPPHSPAEAAPSHHQPSRHQLHRTLFVGGFGTPAIASAQVSRNGSMTAVPGSPFGSGPLSLGMAITPDAKTLYSVSAGISIGPLAVVPGTVDGYRIHRNGTLTQLSDATVTVGSPVIGAAITPDGSRLFVSVTQDTGGALLSYSISPSGGLTPTGAQPTPIPSGISQVAISPDARYLFVTNYLANTVSSFAIGADASLTPVGAPVAAGVLPVMPAVTPNGRYLYVSNEGSGTISGYAIGSDGVLTPVPGSPYTSGGTTHNAAITPDSHRIYFSNATASTITGWQIGADGQLTPLPGSPYPSPNVARVILSPDAHHLFAVEGLVPSGVSGFVAGGSSKVSTLTVRPNGSLTATHFAPLDTGLFWHDGSNAFLTPNQGPVATLSASGHGSTRSFSAAGSDDPDGRVASYHWDFGDGHQQTTTSPRTTHHYATAGTRTATVTVTDDEGCSTQLIYNGTTVECRGGSQATASVAVSVGSH
jgi:6-phosphogluconolactonase (cycloisomerase 2 family)